MIILVCRLSFCSEIILCRRGQLEGDNAQPGPWKDRMTDAALREMVTLCNAVEMDRITYGDAFNKPFMKMKQYEAGSVQNKRKSLLGPIEAADQKKARMVLDDFDDDNNASSDESDNANSDN